MHSYRLKTQNNSLSFKRIVQTRPPHLARQLFDTIPQPTTVLWNTIIIGFICNNMPHEAISFYSRLNHVGSSICDQYTYSSVLKACAETKRILVEIGDVRIADVLYVLLVKLGNAYVNDLFVVSAAIVMYAELGCVDLATRIFENTCERNTELWNSMINGYIQNNFPLKAVDLFLEAVEAEDAVTTDDVTFQNGLEPDAVTFVAVLSTCSYTGLADTGL
ncbi:hypothetical protein MTR67_047370 [Solanum verrucosum]|uniref:Pentatricopeptide repeat-containing protein n=1 Tax=Solanum verrucosum TaxID=315347 RepID=A0AAF0UXQ8_SOLVR|nr:hypothetical protein MTR67_047370 [Solanum verrucosum]